jgi:Pyruvate/2-oxoacid:ferredoxin oxidoreductase gamma subunit
MIKAVSTRSRRTTRRTTSRSASRTTSPTCLDYDDNFDIEPGRSSAMFYGLGSDGTVGANKNSIKIIGEETDLYAQGYFVYDSKKSGAITVSHLRFGPKPIRGTYLVARRASSPATSGPSSRSTTCSRTPPGRHPAAQLAALPDESGTRCPRGAGGQILEKKLKLYTIDAYEVAKETGMGVRINTIMQTCFFAISGVLPRDEAIAKIKDAIHKTYGKRGDEVVRRNYAAVDGTLSPSARGQDPGQDGELGTCVRRSSDDARRLHPERHRDDDGRQGRPAPGQRLPGRRHLAHRHHPVGEAQHRDRPSRSGIRRSASSATSAPWSARTRRSAPRSTSRASSKERAGELPSRSTTRPRTSAAGSTRSRWLRRTAPAASSACSLPGQGQVQPQAQGDQHDAAQRGRGRERSTTTSSSISPQVDRETASAASTPRARSCSSRSSSTPAPAPAAARRPTSSCSPSSSATAS